MNIQFLSFQYTFKHLGKLVNKKGKISFLKEIIVYQKEKR